MRNIRRRLIAGSDEFPQDLVEEAVERLNKAKDLLDVQYAFIELAEKTSYEKEFKDRTLLFEFIKDEIPLLNHAKKYIKRVGIRHDIDEKDITDFEKQLINEIVAQCEYMAEITGIDKQLDVKKIVLPIVSKEIKI